MTDVYVFAQTIKASLLKLFEGEGNTSLPSREIKKKK